MKITLLVIICVLSHEAFSQAEISNPSYNIGPHPESLNSLPQTNQNGGVINYAHYDLNGTSYSGGKRDLSEIDRVIPYKEKYSDENFVIGNLIYISGNQSKVVKMNYHLLFGEMQFINEKGDTLFIANTDSIAFVRFEKALYLHTSNNDYLKIIGGNNQVKLCLQQKLKVNHHHHTTNIHFNVPVEQLVISKKNSYCLIDKENQWEATKDGFQKAFPKYSQQIVVYLQQMARQRTPIKFHKEDDLSSLLKFCESLL